MKIVCVVIVKIQKEINNLLRKLKVTSKKKAFIIAALHKKDVIAKNLHAKKSTVNVLMRESPAQLLVNVKTVTIQKIQILKNCKVYRRWLRIVFPSFSRVVFYKRVCEISKIYEITSLMMFFFISIIEFYNFHNLHILF